MMSNSHFQTIDIRCPNDECKQLNTVTTWLIIDTTEHPELMERVSSGTIHTAECPHCGAQQAFPNIPLLIYNPTEHLPLLFVSPESSKPDDLIEILRERLGENWDNNWRVLTVQEAEMIKQLGDDLEQRAITNLEQLQQKMQHEFLAREMIRLLHIDLGDDEEQEQADTLRERVAEINAPEYVKTQLLTEIRRLSRQNELFSVESEVIRDYTDLIFSLPWIDSLVKEQSLSETRKMLDEDHYGLDIVKQRILEHLAVLYLIKDNPEAPILCLVGPPGVGKTSLCHSIARALGRAFVKINLGGVHDEADIRGHRRTYIGAYPGRIIKGIQRAQAKNPVCMLDEIDKLGTGFNGDPAWALLEVLDPHYNHSFSDHYLEIAYDLSSVFFIATANQLGDIPEPLRDRMEVIELSGYTLDEKMHIAHDFLFPRQVKLNGLPDAAVKLTDTALRKIITDYTHEEGVRELERMISRLCRRVALQVALSQESENKMEMDSLTIYIDIDNLSRYLGKEAWKDAHVRPEYISSGRRTLSLQEVAPKRVTSTASANSLDSQSPTRSHRLPKNGELVMMFSENKEHLQMIVEEALLPYGADLAMQGAKEGEQRFGIPDIELAVLSVSALIATTALQAFIQEMVKKVLPSTKSDKKKREDTEARIKELECEVHELKKTISDLGSTENLDTKEIKAKLVIQLQQLPSQLPIKLPEDEELLANLLDLGLSDRKARRVSRSIADRLERLGKQQGENLTRDDKG